MTEIGLIFSKLVVVFLCNDSSELEIVTLLQKRYLPQRLTILLYVVDKMHPHYSHFPVNFLRNLAIRNIRTTHFLVLDMDLRMTSNHNIMIIILANTYEEIRSLPSYVTDSNKTAVILPIFFFNHTTILRSCHTIESCAALYSFVSSLNDRTAWYQPENKAELIACMHSLNCFSNKRLVRTHVRDTNEERS